MCEEVGLATAGLNYNMHLTRENYREDGAGLLSEMVTSRMRDKSEKLHREILQV